MQHTTSLNGSEALLRKVRAELTEAGSSLRAWCLNNGVTPSYAHRALTGDRNGPAAVQLRMRILADAVKDAA
jgi:hypothetical protein